jgi:hypothetical protein
MDELREKAERYKAAVAANADREAITRESVAEEWAAQKALADYVLTHPSVIVELVCKEKAMQG